MLTTACTALDASPPFAMPTSAAIWPPAAPPDEDKPTNGEVRLREDVIQGEDVRVANMDVAVGIGRAVMQHEFRLALRGFAELAVEVDLVPPRQHFRFAGRQACAHRKFGLRQVEGLGIVVRIGFGGLVGHNGSGLLEWR